jgi:nucleoside-diphosphate-sugar epimerase
MDIDKTLIIGALGQVGSELSTLLKQEYGENSVVLSDIKEPESDIGLFEKLDVLQADSLAEVVKKHHIKQIYHLAAILSATGEKNPLWAWDINMRGLLNVLEVCKELSVEKVFWPSTIAVFGSHIPSQNTPQHVPLYPSTVYGISKAAGELWCQYYFEKYGLDVRSLRYPGLISYVAPPGGGTTDYAVEIFYQALQKQKFECFLQQDTYLPMLYMPDAVRATLELMQAPKESVKIRTSYNLGGLSFSPQEIYQAIKQHLPDFEIEYRPDFRQKIAASWPQSIDDSAAQADWGWSPRYDLNAMTADMLKNLSHKLLLK